MSARIFLAEEPKPDDDTGCVEPYLLPTLADVEVIGTDEFAFPTEGAT